MQKIAFPAEQKACGIKDCLIQHRGNGAENNRQEIVFTVKVFLAAAKQKADGQIQHGIKTDHCAEENIHQQSRTASYDSPFLTAAEQGIGSDDNQSRIGEDALDRQKGEQGRLQDKIDEDDQCGNGYPHSESPAS